MGLHSMMQNLHTKDAVPAAPAVSGDRPSRKQIYQNRWQWGPNLGSLFVQEKWIDSSLFTDKAPGDSELDALVGYEKAGKSLDETKQAWEEHWRSFVSDDDWGWLQSRGVTAVRLPIGFWSVGAKFAKKTPFEKYAKVYENSWAAVHDVIRKAAQHNIGVLVDVHAVPGGANPESHSGTSSKTAAFWGTAGFRDAAIDLYVFLAQDLAKEENVVGLQLVNEAPYGESKLEPFYLDAVKQIRKVNSEIPLVISDAWDLGSWRNKVKQLNADVSSKKEPATTGIVVDTHVYRMFSDDDKRKSAEEHVNAAGNAVPVDNEVDTMVGEYSCVLSEESWGQGGDRDQLEVRYGQDQTRNFASATRAGAYFWTFKFAQGPGGGWDFRVMSDKGALPSPPRGPPQNAGDAQQALGPALDQHRQYWEGQDGKQDWEHWRFEAGFTRGYQDAQAFAEFDGSRPGRVAALATARLAEHVKDKGASDKTWVFNQAYVQGIDAYASQLQ